MRPCCRDADGARVSLVSQPVDRWMLLAEMALLVLVPRRRSPQRLRTLEAVRVVLVVVLKLKRQRYWPAAIEALVLGEAVAAAGVTAVVADVAVHLEVQGFVQLKMGAVVPAAAGWFLCRICARVATVCGPHDEVPQWSLIFALFCKFKRLFLFNFSFWDSYRFNII